MLKQHDFRRRMILPIVFSICRVKKSSSFFSTFISIGIYVFQYDEEKIIHKLAV